MPGGCGCGAGSNAPRKLVPPQHYITPGQRGFYPDQPEIDKPPRLGRKVEDLPNRPPKTPEGLKALAPTVIPIQEQNKTPHQLTGYIDRKNQQRNRDNKSPVNFPKVPEGYEQKKDEKSGINKENQAQSGNKSALGQRKGRLEDE